MISKEDEYFFNRRVSSTLLCIFFGVSLFAFDPGYLLIFSYVSLALIKSLVVLEKIPKRTHDIGWITLAIIVSSVLNSTSYNIPLILLGTAIFFLSYTALYSLEEKDFYRFLLLFSLFFATFEFRIIWISLSMPGLTPESIIVRLGSPAILVPNDFAYFTILFPFFVLASLKTFNRRFHSVFLIFLYSISLYTAVILESRLALFGFLLPALVISYRIISPKKKIYIMLALAPLLLLITALPFFADKGTASIETRIVLWISALNGILDGPLAGNGLGSFGAFYELQKLNGNLITSSYLAMDSRYIPWPHNLFLEIMYSFGLLVIIPIGLILKNIGPLNCKKLDVNITVLASVAVFFVLGFLEMTLLRLITLPILLIVVLMIDRSKKSFVYGN